MSMPTELVAFAFRFAQEVAINTVFEVEPDDDDKESLNDTNRAEEEPQDLIAGEDPFGDN